MAEVANYEKSNAFSELEKLALRYTDEITRTPVDVPEELFRALAEHLTPKQMVELTEAIAIENMSARFNHAFDIGSDHLTQD